MKKQIIYYEKIVALMTSLHEGRSLRNMFCLWQVWTQCSVMTSCQKRRHQPGGGLFLADKINRSNHCMKWQKLRSRWNQTERQNWYVRFWL